MIACIQGKVLEVEDGRAVILANGIGWELTTTAGAAARLKEGETCEPLPTTQVFREDGQELFLFGDKEEKSLFQSLKKVGGVGPKTAMAILNGASPTEIRQAIVENNGRALCAIKGIGEKTAARIILELREKTIAPTKSPTNELEETALSALTQLGIAKEKAKAAIAGIPKEEKTSIPEICQKALRALDTHPQE